MPLRKVPLVTGEFYHVFNRGVAYQPVFVNVWDYKRLLETIEFYQYTNPPLRFSKLLLLPKEERSLIRQKITQTKDFLVQIIAYCLMPNHFHLLLKQTKDEGIKRFISQIINSYTKYFNTKRKRFGPLFQGRFKAVRIETEEQLLHLSRYIHLNPFSSFLIKEINDLPQYFYSSFPEYLGKTSKELCNKEAIINDSRSRDDYQKFVFDNADYQKRLQEIKHLLMEE